MLSQALRYRIGVMERPVTSSHVILIGPMGAGKSTIGRGVASRLSRPFIDSDDVIEQREGATGADIAAARGIERLHEIELEVFMASVASTAPAVICPAESVVDDPAARLALGEHRTYWIDADHAMLRDRHAEGPHRRPMGSEEFAARRSEREPFLAAVSAARIDTTSTPVDACVDAVCEGMGVIR